MSDAGSAIETRAVGGQTLPAESTREPFIKSWWGFVNLGVWLGYALLARFVIAPWAWPYCHAFALWILGRH
jgi:hypothetical protein